jgi:hypothetical protein
MTVACVLSAWLTTSLEWIHRRHAYLADLRPHVVRAVDDNKMLISWNRLPGDTAYQSAPGGLWLLGEKGIGHLNIPWPKSHFTRPRPNVTSWYLDEENSVVREARSLFPESKIMIFPYADE